MKGIVKWSEEDRRGGTSVGNFEPPSQEDIESVRHHAFMRGFKLAREKAAGLIESFGNPKFDGVPLLIRAIGEGDTSDIERP